jgi:hypothetical protein
MPNNVADPSGRPDGQPAPAPAPAPSFAFISYVREDSEQVEKLQQTLEAARIPVWRDTHNLLPGQDWSASIREAVTNDAMVFIACFSRASTSRAKSYQNYEFLLAIDQLKQRRPGTHWLIPVRLDDCEIPDLDIGGGRTLRSLQSADLFGDRIEEKTARLVAAILHGRGQSGPTSGWRVGVVSLRRLAIVAPVSIVAMLAIAIYGLHSASGQPVTVTGSVICESGQSLAGVWIAASSGQTDSGFAHLGPRDTIGPSFPAGAEGTYSYRLPHGGSYAVHVGCGQTKHGWISSDFSPLLSTRTAKLRCGRPIVASSKPMPKGRCVVATMP